VQIAQGVGCLVWQAKVKKLTLASYHLFQFRGQKYAFDIESSAVLKVDTPAFDALSLRLTDPSEDAAASALAATYGEQMAQNVMGELHWLEQKGLFHGPLYTYDAQDNEDYIQRLTRMSTNKIELYLAEACNLRCRYCYVDANDALSGGLMPWEVAKQAIDLVFHRAGNAREIDITFFGGEPLLNKPVFREAVRYSQQLGADQGKVVRYSMTTNGTLLDDEIIDYIKRYHFGLMVSLDGPKEVHDRVRPFADGRGSFDVAARNIKRLMQQRRSVTVRCTLSNRCLDWIGIVKFLEDFGFTRLAMSRCTGKSYCLGPYDIGPEESTVLRAQDDYFIEHLFQQLDRGEQIRFNPWATALRNIHDRQNRRLRCGVGRGCTTVGVDGRLYPCHRYVGMENYVLGHVSTGIDQEKFAAYLRSYFETKKKCETCWAINICGGYCPWYVSHDDGTCLPPQDWWCEEVRSWYEQGIWLYDTLQNQYPEYFRQLVGGDGALAQIADPVLR
jgi:uncharacterized protein